jgi:hypothetical protein
MILLLITNAVFIPNEKRIPDFYPTIRIRPIASLSFASLSSVNISCSPARDPGGFLILQSVYNFENNAWNNSVAGP